MNRKLIAAVAGLVLILAGCTSTPAPAPAPAPAPTPAPVTVTATATATATPSTVASPSTSVSPKPSESAGSTLTTPSTTRSAAPPSVLTVTETPASPYSFPFDVVQGTSADELGIVSLIIDPANNNTWGPNSNTTLVPVFVACETNLEPASQNPYQFDCNIAFADGSVQSYWVSYNQTHTDFVATKRTY